MIVSVIFIGLTAIGSMGGKHGIMILGIDAGLPIGIALPVTALASLLSGRFKIGARREDIQTRECEGNMR
jgi:hypothetical protein